MVATPFRPGLFVWCAFPESERPIVPGPPHLAYVLAVASDDRGHAAMVAYTTSQPWMGRKPAGVISFAADQAKTMGQGRPFVLDLRRIALLPLDTDWFPFLDQPGRGVVGEAPHTVQARIETEAKELHRRRPEVIRRSGPLWRRR